MLSSRLQGEALNSGFMGEKLRSVYLVLAAVISFSNYLILSSSLNMSFLSVDLFLSIKRRGVSLGVLREEWALLD